MAHGLCVFYNGPYLWINFPFQVIPGAKLFSRTRLLRSLLSPIFAFADSDDDAIASTNYCLSACCSAFYRELAKI